jgi:hypothetical protein
MYKDLFVDHDVFFITATPLNLFHSAANHFTLHTLITSNLLHIMYSTTSGRNSWPVEVHGQYDDTICFVTIIFLVLYLVVAYNTCPPTAPAPVKSLQKATLHWKFKLFAHQSRTPAESKSLVQRYLQYTTPRSRHLLPQHTHALLAGPSASNIRAEILYHLHYISPCSRQHLLTDYAHNSPSAGLSTSSLRRQHTILHLHIPGDLLADLDISDLSLIRLGIVIPGWENNILGRPITPPDPPEEPCNKVWRVRAKPPQRIELPPAEDPSDSTWCRFHDARWDSMNAEEIRRRIAYYQSRVDSGEAALVHQLHRQSDAPDAPDYVSHHFFGQTYNLASFQAAYRRDPWGVMQMLQREPEMGRRLGQWRGAAVRWRDLCPELFEECFGGVLEL